MSQDGGNGSPAALKTRHLLRDEITYAFAREQDASILHELGYRDQKIQFFTHLYRNRELIKKTLSPGILDLILQKHVIWLMWKTG